jgi:capsular exopolysaccharide synthesis family protein
MRPGFGGLPARPGPQAPHDSGGPTLGLLLKGLRRHLGLALGLGLFCAGLTAVVTWYVLPLPKYTATAMLEAAAVKGKIVFDLESSRSNPVTEYKLYQETQQKIITSPFVLAAALRDPKIARLSLVRNQLDPIDWLSRKITVAFTGEILTISLGGNDPEEITQLVNAVTNAYIREVVNAEHNERLDRHAKLKDSFNDYMEKLKDKRKKLQELALEAGSNEKTTLALKQQMQMAHHQDVQHELTRVTGERHKAEMDLQLAMGRAQAPRPAVSDVDIKTAVAGDPNVMALQNEVNSLSERVRDYRARLKNPVDPAITKISQRLAAKKKDLKDLKERLAGELMKQRVAALNDDGNADIEDLKRSIALMKQWEDDLQKTVEKLSLQQGDLNKTTMELQGLQDEIEHAEATVKQMGRETEKLWVELQAPKRVKLLHLADVPKVVNLTKHLAVTGFVGVSSLGLVLFGIAFWETRIQRVDTADEVVRGLGMDLVGVLPALPTPSRGLPARRSSRELQERIWNNILLESVDATRAMILHASRTESLQVLMVASALKGEGKTSLACHLATSLARARRRTLLIDCDLRSPAVHRMFDVLSEPGICEILRGQATAVEAIQPTVAQGLSILPAGRCDAAAVQALAQGRLGEVFDELKPQFDYIIVDTAPVLPVADSLQVCQHVDAVVFSVLRDVSRLPKVYAAYERLAMLGVRMLGAVVAGTRCEHYASSYSYNMPHEGA